MFNYVIGEMMVFLHVWCRYQRSTTAVSIGKLSSFHDNLFFSGYFHDKWHAISFFSVAPVCYAHLAASQMLQFVKFEDSSDSSSWHGSVTVAGTILVPELPRLHPRISRSMFFCWGKDTAGQTSLWIMKLLQFFPCE